MRKSKQEGIALVTSLLVLLLVSSMIVGLAWLVVGDVKLGGNNRDRQLAFYAAEAGMEQMTASLENAFDANYALNTTAITALMTTPGPPVISGVKYIAPGSTTNGSGYNILPNATNPNNLSNPSIPASSYSTISTGPYAGLVGLMTPYTLTVTAQTAYGSEVRLQREVQTVEIPVFQFGFFSQTDLSFFAGPDFNFGGRVHSNGNLWLAEGDGKTLTLPQKATAAGEMITANLENGWDTTTNYTGTVNITTGSSTANLKTQSPPQSVTGSGTNANYYGNISSYASGFSAMASSIYHNNIGVKETGVKPLDLTIATPAIGGQSIDLIRRPVSGEDVSNPGKLVERYYGNPLLSMRILLSNYGASGTCTDSDINTASATALPKLSPNGAGNTVTPVDLATLAWDAGTPNGLLNASGPPYQGAPAGLTATNAAQIGISIFPLPVSNSQVAGIYSTTDGYWVKQWYPTITGCLKIEYQDKANPGTWHDVTWEILDLGYTGRNINPQVNHNGVPAYVAAPAQSGYSSTTQTAASGPTANAGVATVGCADPSPNAVIRLARLRDNPSTASNNNNRCGNNPTNGAWSGLASQAGTCTVAGSSPNCPSTLGRDYWPNVLFDTREALLRDTAPAGGVLPVAGAMYYVELDVANLAKWFTGAIGANGTNALNTTGYGVYFSDRRGNVADPTPPASVGATPMLTGGYGYDDIVNPASASGCPNGGTPDQGEDLESDTGSGSSTVRTYGNVLSPLPASLWPVAVNGVAVGTQLGTVSILINGQAAPLINPIMQNNPSCAGPGRNWPYAVAFSTNGFDLRENPPIFYRRALKLVHGDTITLGTCNSVPCGLAVIAENPVYVQGDYNNPGLNTNFSGVGVGASVISDAVTLLSDNWNDANSFRWPYTLGDRAALSTTYRFAAAAGKGIPFQQPTVGGVGQDFGTDGGAHNFLRYLENWGGQTLYYSGSIVSLYYNHQAVGVYKCCTNVYSPPTRGYQFDTNFLTPNLLPPLTPMLRHINTIGFTQMLLPTQ